MLEILLVIDKRLIKKLLLKLKKEKKVKLLKLNKVLNEDLHKKVDIFIFKKIKL